jgi:hypothetical protein
MEQGHGYHDLREDLEDALGKRKQKRTKGRTKEIGSSQQDYTSSEISAPNFWQRSIKS